MGNSNRFREKFKQADKAFNGAYKNELIQLVGLSRDEIDAITPGTTDLRVYAVLMDIVKEASQKNTKQADLIDDISDLGEVAVKIARKIPQFAALL